MSFNPTKKPACIEELQSCSVLVESREIFLHGHIGSDTDDPGVDYKMAMRFLQNLRYLIHLNKEPVIIHQHSIGGDWNAGMVIFDAIKTCEAYVIILTHGIAASMGSVIPQAADFRLTMPNCDWLIHDGTTGINEELLRKQAKSWAVWEDRLDKVMLEMYASRCCEAPKHTNKNISQVKNFLTKQLEKSTDWWLSAEEAVAEGFADGIYGVEPFLNIASLETIIFK